MAVPSLLCDPPTSTNGDITVTWFYIHTGGLPLTNVSLTIFNDGPESATDFILQSADTQSIEIPHLVAGFEYTFNVTAVNSIGSSSISCGPVFHRPGEPSVIKD